MTQSLVMTGGLLLNILLLILAVEIAIILTILLLRLIPRAVVWFSIRIAVYPLIAMVPKKKSQRRGSRRKMEADRGLPFRLEAVSLHEAGHAVVNWALEARDVKWITIQGFPYCFLPLAGCVYYHPGPLFRPATIVHPLDEITICLAGQAAEELFAGHIDFFIDGNDHQDAMDICRELIHAYYRVISKEFEEDKAIATLKEMFDRALAILELHEPLVRMVQEELLNYSHIPGWRFKQIIATYKRTLPKQR